jgi:hypothetical protein
VAKWVYNRPLDCCDETELRVAKLLARLPDEWIVRWGYYYAKDREGDFLILGPHGGLLVLEVKGGQIRKLGSTGCWDGEARDHPVSQLCAEWSAVLDQMKAVERGLAGGFVHGGEEFLRALLVFGLKAVAGTGDPVDTVIGAAAVTVSNHSESSFHDVCSLYAQTPGFR